MLRYLLTLCVTLGLGVSTLQAQDEFLGKTVDGWAAQLKTGADAKQRRSAAYALGKMGGKAASAVPALKGVYEQEKDAKVREAILFGLGEIVREAKGNAELEPLFLAAVKDQDPYLRRSAAFALGCLATKSDATRAALEAALGDTEAMVRQNAAYALGQFKEAALPALKKALADPDSLVKRDAASLLMPPTMTYVEDVRKLLPELLPLCRDHNSETRRAALNVLVQIVDRSDKAAIPDLRWELVDRDIENKRNAAFALSKIGGPESAVAVPILLEAAKNGDLDMRRSTLRTLRNIGPYAASALKELVGYLKNDKDAEVRISVALALGGMGRAAEPAIPALVANIGNAKEVPEVRCECAMALSRMGSTPATRAVAPALLAILSDPGQNGAVREKAWWALKVHGGELSRMKGTFEAFSAVCKEPSTKENRMVRYNSAYLLGMVWQSKAPDPALDVLEEYLKDKQIKVFVDVLVKVKDIKSAEGKKTADGKVEVRGEGDGRKLAADALRAIGGARYAQRQDIMKQLRVLAVSATDPDLKTKATELIKAAQ